MSGPEVHYTESEVEPGTDWTSAAIALAVEGNPYLLLTLEELTDEDGLSADEQERAGGFKIVARVGNGLNGKKDARVFLQKALASIPE
jgi:hypothetical protein